MSSIRKALWPAAIALSLMVFMAIAGGTSVQKAYADHGDLCGIGVVDDIQFVEDDDGELVRVVVDEEGRFFVFAIVHPDEDDDEEDTTYGASLDNAGGSAVIVGVMEDGELQSVNPTGEVAELPANSEEEVEEALGVDIDPENFGNCTVDDDDADEDEDADVLDCDNALGDDLQDNCDLVVIEVECEEEGGGTFDVSFFDENEDDDAISVEIECRGASDDGTLTCHPCTVEIIPAPGNVAHSLIRLELVDEHGEAAFPGEEVLFTVDRCGIEESEVDTEDEFEEAEELFEDFGPNVPSVAAAIENSDFATSDPDSNEAEDNTDSFTVTDDGDDERTIAAAIVHCDIGHTQESVPTPGVITVTAIVEQEGADDIYTVKITVVGPPATITVNASPAELRCGEKAQIVVVVKDSIGQNVSDHTPVEAVTNAGGVLGGTGAVIGQAGPVVPISSTVAETFGGTTTFFLLTSEQHSGPYEVVVTTGGANVTAAGGLSGLFSSAPISVQTTVRCSIPVVAAPVAPAAVPTVTAPRTGDLGTGTIRPPSTGDAGLADASGANWGLLAVAGVVTFGLAGVATVKVSRR